MKASTKYWVLGGLTTLLAIVTYFSGHLQLTETTLIGAGLVAIPLAISEFESAPTSG